MPNANYRSGRALEYSRKKFWESKNYAVVRSSGSHGIWDLAAVHRSNPEKPVLLIQCKVVKNLIDASVLYRKLRKNPPLPVSTKYEFLLEVKVRGGKETYTYQLNYDE